MLTELPKSTVAFLGPVASGALLAVSFRAELSPLAFIGLLPIASAFSRRTQLLATYVGAYFGGLAFNLITADWMRTLEGGQGLAGPSAPNWMCQAQALALFWPTTIFLGRRFVQAMPFLTMSISLPLVWLCHEFLVRHASILIDETGWPFYFLGYSTEPYVALRQLADISGVSTVSMLVACINGGLWDIGCVLRRWRSYQRANVALVRVALLPTVLLLASYGYGKWRLTECEMHTGPSVMLMPRGSLDTIANCAACVLTVQKNPTKPDLMLWSETALHSTIFVPKGWVAVDVLKQGSRLGAASQHGMTGYSRLGDLEQVAKTAGAAIVLGCTRAENGSTGVREFNSSIFIDPRFGLRGFYDKVYLVPQQEFIPSTVFFSGVRNTYERGTEFPLFSLNSQQSDGNFIFSMSICYDIAFPQLYLKYMRKGPRLPDFFTVCSSERSDSTGRLARDLLTMGQFRAIECRRTIVRNVYCGYSGVIDSMGRLERHSIDWLIDKPTFIQNIPIDSRTTLFVRLGDWLSIGCAIAVAGVELVSAGRRLIPRRAATTLHPLQN
jgi:apolipoprotein N-acyltransferase